MGARWDWDVAKGRGRRDNHPRIPLRRNLFREFLYGYSCVLGTTMIRTDLMKVRVRFDPAIDVCEERDMLLKLAMLGPFVICPDLALKYRLRSGGQQRPSDIRARRAQVYEAAIGRLPKREQQTARRLRASADLMDKALDAMRDGHPPAAFRHAVAAYVTYPQMVLMLLELPRRLRWILYAGLKRLRGEAGPVSSTPIEPGGTS